MQVIFLGPWQPHVFWRARESEVIPGPSVVRPSCHCPLNRSGTSEYPNLEFLAVGNVWVHLMHSYHLPDEKTEVCFCFKIEGWAPMKTEDLGQDIHTVNYFWLLHLSSPLTLFSFQLCTWNNNNKIQVNISRIFSIGYNITLDTPTFVSLFFPPLCLYPLVIIYFNVLVTKQTNIQKMLMTN